MKTYTLKNTYKSGEDYSCDFPIDLVILWCDDTPEFRAKRIYWQNKLGLQQDENIIPERFETVDELKYLLRSVEMYAPWINHIFIVTDNQKPKWLNPQNEKVTIVDHTEFMPKNALPNFNASALEVYLFNIPNLSEHFLFANDDTMFARPVKPEDFFDKNGNPIARMRKDFLFTDNNHARMVLKGYACVEKKNNIKFKEKYHTHHNIDAYRRSYYEDFFHQYKKEMTATGNHKFRKDTDLHRTAIYVSDILQGKATLKLMDAQNTDSDILWTCSEGNVKKRICAKMICLNTPSDQSKRFLQYHYPQPSSFEIIPAFKKVYKFFGFLPILSVEEK